MMRKRSRTASHWGSYWISTENDEVVGVEPVEHDPHPSPIGQNYLETLRSRTRVLRPAIRESWLKAGPGRRSDGRGVDRFVEVSWDRATELVAGEIDRVRTDHGNQAIFGGSYGWASAGRFHHAQSQIHRFLNVVGGYTRSVDNYSDAAELVTLPHVVGDREMFVKNVPRWSEVAQHGEYVLAFGGLPRRSLQVSPGGVGAHVNEEWQRACAQAGVQFTIVTPTPADTAPELGAEHVSLRPGTDVAMMLGLCHELLMTGLYDRDFVQRCCVGFDTVSRYLLGEEDGVEKSAKWAAEICDIPAQTIVDIAHRLASTRSLVTPTFSVQRQHHGEMTYWAAITLAAMAGSMGKPGGGFGPGYSSMHYSYVYPHLSVAAALPQGFNPIADFIPVARISDMLLAPGAEFNYNGGRYAYPDIRLVYWAGGNPFHHHQDINKLLKAWRRPETIIVHEPYWNSMAKHADIVMPVATSLERSDITFGHGDRWLIHSEKAADPPPGVRTDFDTFAGIAELLGVGERFTEGRDADEWVQELYSQSVKKAALGGIRLPPYREFVDRGALELPVQRHSSNALAKFRAAPERHPLATPSGRIELYSATVANFDYDDCPGHAAWFEPAEWLGSPKAARYGLHLLSPQPDGKLHSQFDHGVESGRHKIRGMTALQMNESDADARAVNDGDVVEVYNGRGRCLAAVRVNQGLRRGVVQLPTGSWYDPLRPGEVGTLDKNGNPNVLTPDIGTSQLAQGPSSHTCLVEVRRWKGPVPKITAYDSPTMSID